MHSGLWLGVSTLRLKGKGGELGPPYRYGQSLLHCYLPPLASYVKNECVSKSLLMGDGSGSGDGDSGGTNGCDAGGPPTAEFSNAALWASNANDADLLKAPPDPRGNENGRPSLWRIGGSDAVVHRPPLCISSFCCAT